MKTLKLQRGILNLDGLLDDKSPKSKEQSTNTFTQPILGGGARKSKSFIAMLKIFYVWFFLGAGLLFSASLCIIALYEMVAGKDDAMIAFAIFVFAGGIFCGLLAIAISRLSQPYFSLPNGLIRGEALLEYANHLGISLKHLYDDKGNLQEPELQRRILDVEKACRERWFLIVTIGAAVFSGLSAIAAWIANFK